MKFKEGRWWERSMCGMKRIEGISDSAPALSAAGWFEGVLVVESMVGRAVLRDGRRIVAPETLPPTRWSLGRWGILVNASGGCFAVWAMFWAFWPGEAVFASDTFNWASVMFGGATVLSVVLYVVQGRREYVPPVVLVRKVR